MLSIFSCVDFLLSTLCFNDMQNSLRRTPQTTLIPDNCKSRCTSVCLSIAWVLLLFVYLIPDPASCWSCSFCFQICWGASGIFSISGGGDGVCLRGLQPRTEPFPGDMWCKHVGPWYMKAWTPQHGQWCPGWGLAPCHTKWGLPPGDSWESERARRLPLGTDPSWHVAALLPGPGSWNPAIIMAILPSKRGLLTYWGAKIGVCWHFSCPPSWFVQNVLSFYLIKRGSLASGREAFALALKPQ